MEGMPSTVAYESEFAFLGDSDIRQQRVLLFGPVRCSDPAGLLSSFNDWGQGFRHGRASTRRQAFGQEACGQEAFGQEAFGQDGQDSSYRQQYLDQHLERHMHRQFYKPIYKTKEDYFMNLGGGASSHKH